MQKLQIRQLNLQKLQITTKSLKVSLKQLQSTTTYLNDQQHSHIQYKPYIHRVKKGLLGMNSAITQ